MDDRRAWFSRCGCFQDAEDRNKTGGLVSNVRASQAQSLDYGFSQRLLCGVVWMCYNLWADEDGRGTGNGSGRQSGIASDSVS